MLFPDRIEPDSKLQSSARALNGTIQRVLNQPSTDRVPIEEERDQRFAAVYAPSKNVSESNLEKALECSRSFREKFALKKVMRQWPVGLFEGRVAKNKYNSLFTGGKSAIDLIGISNNTLVLFELKTHLNRNVGAISELLFYASVMRDAIRGDFQFEDQSLPKNCAVTPGDILRCSNIRAVLIAPRTMHPLIQNPAIFRELNAALAQHWINPSHSKQRRSKIFRVIRMGTLAFKRNAVLRNGNKNAPCPARRRKASVWSDLSAEWGLMRCEGSHCQR
jgi:hypothetical protein